MSDTQPKVTITRRVQEIDELLVAAPVGSARRLTLLRRQAKLVDQREAAIARARRAFYER